MKLLALCEIVLLFLRLYIKYNFDLCSVTSVLTIHLRCQTKLLTRRKKILETSTFIPFFYSFLLLVSLYFLKRRFSLRTRPCKLVGEKDLRAVRPGKFPAGRELQPCSPSCPTRNSASTASRNRLLWLCMPGSRTRS